jgi:exodeoxyribonuclease VII small subunit
MTDSPPEPAFEALLSRLSEVVSELEKGDLPLERALTLFEEGLKLARAGNDRLDRAEARVDELLAVSERGMRVRNLETVPVPREPPPTKDLP